MTVTIAATVETERLPPRVRLDIATNQATVTVHRVAADGKRTAVRTYDGGPLPVTGGTVLLYDAEAPYGLPVRYTADGSGVTDSATVTISADVPWLIHPGRPELSRPIVVAAIGGRSRQAPQSVRYPLGAKYPIVATDGQRKSASYELTIRTHTLTELTALDALTDDLGVLLLNVPDGLGWGLGAEYVSVGDLSEDRTVRWGPHPYRDWRLPCTVTSRPVGGQQAFNNYRRSYEAYPTYTARAAAHATYGAAFAAE